MSQQLKIDLNHLVSKLLKGFDLGEAVKKILL